MTPSPGHAAKTTQLRGRFENGDTTPASGVRATPPSETRPKQQYSLGLSRSDSKRAPTRQRPHDSQASPQPDVLDSKELEKLGKSTTSHLRTLSKLSESGAKGDFKIVSAEQEVAGLQGRRRLQRTNSAKGRRNMGMPGYGGRTWMDQQRQFLQAYEYLCHIGEAKEWIEDIINKPIPPIVQLEEALRDGVTLAEVVQALRPDRRFRIFQNPKLQFRHSDNTAIFFNFLSEVELPELFRFELVDLYEKKNIPKVIYCIHALSWILFRKGIVDFRIGNLVGHLQFEDHELEAMQKGLDKAGISMPNFSGMGEKLGAEPEPEPEPEETEDERVHRELHDCQEAVLDFQAQMRGALVRLQLGDTMQHLWDNEDCLIDLQSRIRGDFSRQVLGYRLQMRRFAIGLQSISRGFLVRSRERRKEDHWKDREKDIILLQSLVRARAARVQAEALRTKVHSHQHGTLTVQAAIRGALARRRVAERQVETRRIEPVVVKLQASLRAWQARHQHQKISRQIDTHRQGWISLTSLAKAHLIRQSVRRTKASAIAEGQAVTSLQSLVRGRMSRQTQANLQHNLGKCSPAIGLLQAFARGCIERTRIYDLLREIDKHDAGVTTLQAFGKALLVRGRIADDLEELDRREESIVKLQTAARGMLVRAKFAEKQRFYQENMKKVVKIQSFVRGRQQGEAYKSLTSGKNPPVGTVKNFVHLLNDSDFDFDEELRKSCSGCQRGQQWLMFSRVGEASEDVVSTRPSKRGIGTQHYGVGLEDWPARANQDQQ